VISVSSLTRYYGTHAAVKDVSFSIADKEVVGFLGLNGAGKTTTLKVLAGLIMPTAGEVCIGGVDVLNAPDSFRERIGFLPESPPLYKEMQVAEFLHWVGRIKGLSKADLKTRLPEVLDLCQLTPRKDWVINTLSHGFQKRVGIAQAIIHRPQLVLLDEPNAGLDPAQIVEMRKVLVALKAESTVLISSHILSEVSQTCDRILVLHDGHIVAEGTESELAQQLGQGQSAVTSFELVVRGDAQLATGLMDDLEPVTGCSAEALGNGCVRLSVSAQSDVREQAAAAIVQAGLGLQGLQRTHRTELENIFLQLTGGGAA
jgi:ABC-2 type transport system ATP-binding protein